MTKILIKDARMVNEGEILQGDLLINNGRIEKIGRDIAAADAQVIAAEGAVLMPGMIDDQVHFREPGVTYKADINSESHAALAGGITSFMEMPNTDPQTVSITALEDKFALAAGRTWANYAFYLGGTNTNIDEICKLKPSQTCGIKVFMGASTGDMLVDDPVILEQIFKQAPTIIATHCEDTPSITVNEEKYRAEYGDNIPMHLHPLIRSEEACWKSSSFAVSLAKKHNTRLHVLHLTTARELALFEQEAGQNKRITAEACVHHLYFSEEDYAEKGGFIKCNPAIKKASDRAALRQALVDGRLDLVATDHAPHTLQEKQESSYFKIPAGLPLVQHAVQMVLELVHDGVLTLEQAVNRMCHSPARIFDVKDRGFLREGYWADLVLLDMDQAQTVTRDDILYKCGWSPLEGRTLKSSILKTFVNGELKYDEGAFLGAANGQRLEFDR